MKKELSKFGLEKELTKEEWEKLLTVVVGNNDNWEEIKRGLKLHIWLRFVVTKNLKIIIANKKEHPDILGDNGLEWEDCLIANGVMREDEDSLKLIFSYQGSLRTVVHDVAEDKVLDFLKKEALN